MPETSMFDGYGTATVGAVKLVAAVLMVIGAMLEKTTLDASGVCANAAKENNATNKKAEETSDNVLRNDKAFMIFIGDVGLVKSA
jgi:hypothetical protein